MVSDLSAHDDLSLDVASLRAEFLVLGRPMRGGRRLVYLDSAATSLKPGAVVAAMDHYLRLGTANVHRGLHLLSEEATAAFEAARGKVRRFLNARDEREVIFTSGTTGALNLMARSFGEHFLEEGDEVLITWMEHHSNIVPWQMLAERRGVKLKVAPIDEHGQLIMSEFERLLTPRTKLVSVAYVSNALGTINPIADIVSRARQHGAKVLVDAAQAASHIALDVQALGCDFLAFSAHKLYGPTGVGVLWGRRELLEEMPPIDGGGDMIKTVSFEKTTYADLPARLEAGTPPIAEVIGLGAAIDWLGERGLARIAAHEARLLEQATRRLADIPGIRLIGTAAAKASVLSFTLDGVHPHDLGTLLDEEGVAVRAGHHCAQPVMQFFKVPATTRASFAAYNDLDDVEALAAAVDKVRSLFQ